MFLVINSVFHGQSAGRATRAGETSKEPGQVQQLREGEAGQGGGGGQSLPGREELSGPHPAAHQGQTGDGGVPRKGQSNPSNMCNEYLTKHYL